MATKNFTQFNTATPLTTSDFIVGYNAAGTAEIKTQVQSILNLYPGSFNQTFLPLSGGTLTGSLSVQNNTYLNNLTANNLVINPSSLANSFYVSENGNVGINTNTPEEALSIDGNLSLSGNLTVRGNSNLSLSGNLNLFGNGNISQLLEVDTIRANTYLNLSGEAIQRVITNLTYAQLTGNIATGTLQSGELYRITDFVTEYISNAGEWISPNNSAFVSANSGTPVAISAIAATPEPLIVLALSSNKIGGSAYSENWPYDIIQYDPSLTLLKNKDNTYSSKGFITYREDTINRIACDYDWRNIRFKRWVLAPLSGTNPISPWAATTAYTQFDLITNSNIVYVCLSAHTSTSSFTTDYNAGRWVGCFNVNGGLLHEPDGLQLQNNLQFSPVLPGGNLNTTVSPKLTAVYGGTSRAGYFNTFSHPTNGNCAITSYRNPGFLYNIKILKSQLYDLFLNTTSGYSGSLPDNVFLFTNSSVILLNIEIQGATGLNNAHNTYNIPNRSNTFYNNIGFGSVMALRVANFKVLGVGGMFNNSFRISTRLENVTIDAAKNIFRDNFFNAVELANTKFSRNVINNIFDQNIIGNNIDGEFHSNFIQNGFYNNTINNNFASNILNRNFQNNTINAPVSTSTFNDLITATHIYQPYNCNIIANTNLETRLTYLTDTGSITAVNVNS